MENFWYNLSVKQRISVAVSGFIALVVFFFVIGNVHVVQPHERALKMRLGQIVGELESGLYFTLPFVESIEKYSVQTLSFSVIIPVAEQGAITKDNQTIGAEMTVFYRFKPDMLRQVKTQYGISRIREILDRTTIQKFKEEVGKSTIFEIAMNQGAISRSVNEAVSGALLEFPFVVENVQVVNYDWSDEFDAQIKETMNRAQQVKQKEQELLITEQEAMKVVKQAEANKEAARLNAEAKALEGEGIRKYNEEITRTIDIEKQFRALEIEKIKAEKWNGQHVPSQVFTPIPLDLKGTVK